MGARDWNLATCVSSPATFIVPPPHAQIDTARHFLTLPAMLEVVDAMSYFKLNTLHVHLSDDDSFSFFVPAYPRLSATGCYSNVSHTHSPADLASLVAFARLRGVRVVPEFDTPAHFSTLIDAYPEYMASAGALQPGDGLRAAPPLDRTRPRFLHRTTTISRLQQQQLPLPR